MFLAISKGKLRLMVLKTIAWPIHELNKNFTEEITLHALSGGIKVEKVYQNMDKKNLNDIKTLFLLEKER